MTRATLLDELEVFYGKAIESLAEVYVRLPSRSGEIANLLAGQSGSPSLAGHVRGPYCEFQRTLPTTAALHDLGPGRSLLARATVVDPCGWSTEVPSWYEVLVELREGDRVVERATRELGIRRFGRRGNSFYWEGRRWVLRAAGCSHAADSTVADCRQAAAALVTQQPSDSLCQRASRSGVLVVPHLLGDIDQIQSRLARLSRWACVGLAIVETDSTDPVDLSAAAPNILLAQRLPATADTGPARWAGALVSPSGPLDPSCWRRLTQHELPVIAAREYDDGASVTQRRAACDQLQRELSTFGDFAGYVVM